MERFGRSDQDIRGMTEHPLALGGRGIAGPQRDRYLGEIGLRGLGPSANSGERFE